jgi:transposase-like protein
MNTGAKRKLMAGAAAALVVAGGGAAVAANKFGSPKEESDAIVADAAKQLGIEPSKLSSALQKALEHRVDAAVAGGRLSKEEGEALKARIESGQLPLFLAGAPHRFRHHGFRHHGPNLEAAATYLGLTRAQLRNELENGKTLAQVATAHGKTADGLVQALLDAAKKKLDAAVAAGRLTRTDADATLAGLEERITDFVNGRFPRPFAHFRDVRSFRAFRGGPPPLFGP